MFYSQVSIKVAVNYGNYSKFTRDTIDAEVVY